MSSQYFPRYMVSKSNIKVFFNLSGYAKEDDLEYLKAKKNIEKKYLVFLVKNKYFNKTSGTKSILSWKSMGISNEIFKPLNNTTLFPKLEYPYPDIVVRFNGSCLVKENKFTFDKKLLNIYIVYELDNNSNAFHSKLKNCLFGSVKVTKKAVILMEKS